MGKTHFGSNPLLTLAHLLNYPLKVKYLNPYVLLPLSFFFFPLFWEDYREVWFSSTTSDLHSCYVIPYLLYFANQRLRGCWKCIQQQCSSAAAQEGSNSCKDFCVNGHHTVTMEGFCLLSMQTLQLCYCVSWDYAGFLLFIGQLQGN